MEGGKPYFAAHFAAHENLGEDKVKKAAAGIVYEELKENNYELAKEIGERFGLEEEKINSILGNQLCEEELL